MWWDGMGEITLSGPASQSAPATPHIEHPHPTSRSWLGLACWLHYQFLLSACLQKAAYVTVITGSIKASVMQNHCAVDTATSQDSEQIT